MNADHKDFTIVITSPHFTVNDKQVQIGQCFVFLLTLLFLNKYLMKTDRTEDEPR